MKCCYHDKKLMVVPQTTEASDGYQEFDLIHIEINLI